MNSSPDEQLRAVTHAQDRMAAARQRGHRDLSLLVVGLGVLLGLLHVGIAAFPPDRSLPAFLAVCAMAVVLIVTIALAWLKCGAVIAAPLVIAGVREVKR